jgi:hypothetical protein
LQLHQNPCFILKKDTSDTQILKQHCTINISNGDRFGLLPDSYWFELLNCSSDDTDIVTSSNVMEFNEDAHSAATEPFENTNNVDIQPNDESQELNFDFNESGDNGSPGSPSLLRKYTIIIIKIFNKILMMLLGVYVAESFHPKYLLQPAPFLSVL